MDETGNTLGVEDTGASCGCRVRNEPTVEYGKGWGSHPETSIRKWLASGRRREQFPSQLIGCLRSGESTSLVDWGKSSIGRRLKEGVCEEGRLAIQVGEQEKEEPRSLRKWIDLSMGSEGSELDEEAEKSFSFSQKAPAAPLGHLGCRPHRERMSSPTCALETPGMQEAWGIKK